MQIEAMIGKRKGILIMRLGEDSISGEYNLGAESLNHPSLRGWDRGLDAISKTFNGLVFNGNIKGGDGLKVRQNWIQANILVFSFY